MKTNAAWFVHLKNCLFQCRPNLIAPIRLLLYALAATRIRLESGNQSLSLWLLLQNSSISAGELCAYGTDWRQLDAIGEHYDVLYTQWKSSTIRLVLVNIVIV